MKKEDILGLLIFFIALGVCLIVALTVFPQYDVFFMDRFWFIILTAGLAFTLNSVGLELLHALGGKLGGYEVVLINVSGIQFEKIAGKWKFHYTDYNGLTGETKLAPKKEKLNLKLFVWAPLIAYILEIAVGALIIALVKDNNFSEVTPSWLALGAAIFITASSMLALYNLMPLKLNNLNDGYRLRLLSDPKNVEAINELYRVENLLRQGEETGEIKTFENINDFTSDVNLYYVYDQLAKKNNKKALDVIDLMLSNKDNLSEYVVYRLLAQKMYALIMIDEEKAKDFYDLEVKDNVRTFIANDRSAESLRAYALIAGIIDKSQSEVILVEKRFTRVNNESLAARKTIEKKLFDEAIEKIYKAHPEWVKENIAA